MEFMLEFISKYGAAGIVLFGIAVAILLFWNGSALSNKKSRIEEALNRKNSTYTLNATSKKMEENDDEAAAITPDTIRKYETEFNAKCSWHGVLVQFIPLFPLLGILGTVAGLMLQVQGGGIEAMLNSLNTALDTTFWGLIAAIVLKVIDAVFPSRIIYDVEVMLDDFDKKLNMAEMFKKFQEEK